MRLSHIVLERNILCLVRIVEDWMMPSQHPLELSVSRLSGVPIMYCNKRAMALYTCGDNDINIDMTWN